MHVCYEQVYLDRFPQLVGRTFGSIAFQLPDGIPFGLVNHFRCASMSSQPVWLQKLLAVPC